LDAISALGPVVKWNVQFPRPSALLLGVPPVSNASRRFEQALNEK
jgi:hypothetical protein